MLQACMSAGARERLARIALVKPEKARSVEDGVLRMAQRGQISEPVSEDRLVQMLEGNSGGAAGEGRRGPKITIQRRNMLDDDDWWHLVVFVHRRWLLRKDASSLRLMN